MTQPAGHDDMFPADPRRPKRGPASRVNAPAAARRTKAPAPGPDLSAGPDHAASNQQPANVELPDAQQVPNAEDNAIVTDTVRRAVGDANFLHWFNHRTRLSVVEDRLVVHVPNPFLLNWILKRFRSDLNRAAELLLGPSGTCQLEVDSNLLQASSSPTAAASSPISAENSAAGSSNTVPAQPAAQAGSSGHSGSPASDAHTGRRKFRSFESFVTGDCNELAVMAARQVAAGPGERFNPLYIYGGTGTGKTHLLEAIYTAVRRRNSNANVVYLTSEGFTNYFTSALNARSVPSFRQRFRNVQVLLIDNIEFLDNKKATQEEFLHTIVQVIEHGGQVVVSSDRHPRLLTRHREELTTRFMSGLVCRIEAPSEAMCSKLTRSLAVGLSATFSDEVLDYVAHRCRKNAREIQGALNILDSRYQLTKRRITLSVAREALSDLSQECRKLVRIADVEKIVCEAFDVKATDLRSKSRRKAISLPRAIAMFVARKLTNSAYREIGQYFGGRDHSTVVAAEKRIAESIELNERLDVPTTCSARTIADLIDYVEARLLSA